MGNRTFIRGEKFTNTDPQKLTSAHDFGGDAIGKSVAGFARLKPGHFFSSVSQRTWQPKNDRISIKKTHQNDQIPTENEVSRTTRKVTSLRPRLQRRPTKKQNKGKTTERGGIGDRKVTRRPPSTLKVVSAPSAWLCSVEIEEQLVLKRNQPIGRWRPVVGLLKVGKLMPQPKKIKVACLHTR